MKTAASDLLRRKFFLRSLLRRRVAALPAVLRRREERAAVAGLLRWPLFKKARRVGLYWSMRGEFPTHALVRLCRKAGKEVFLPRADPAAKKLSFIAWRGPRLRKGAHGIAEPATALAGSAAWERPGAARPVRMDLIFVPGAGFTRRGLRLGSGGGYYDRFLPTCAARRVALAHRVQLVEKLPAARHDVKMDFLATADGIARRR